MEVAWDHKTGVKEKIRLDRNAAHNAFSDWTLTVLRIMRSKTKLVRQAKRRESRLSLKTTSPNGRRVKILPISV